MRVFAVVLIVFLLAVSPVAAQEEDGWWAKFWQNFRGQEREAPPAGAPPPPGTPAVGDSQGVEDWEPPRNAPSPMPRPQPGTPEDYPGDPTGIAPAPPDYIGLPSNCCNVVVCNDESRSSDQREYVCRYSLGECIERYGDTCRQISCLQERCMERVHLCYERTVSPNEPPRVAPKGEYYDSPDGEGHGYATNPYGVEPGTGAVVAPAPPPSPATGSADSFFDVELPDLPDEPSIAPSGKTASGYGAPVPVADASLTGWRKVKCEGSYEECREQYERCQCGMPEAYCEYGGNTYKIGETFRADDGCNHCTCGRDGTIGCTERACVTEVDYCLYNGVRYDLGERFKSNDGCNTCHCSEDGRIQCTLMACQSECGDGICQDNEQECVSMCPDCAEDAVDSDRCACTTTCKTNCDEDCGEKEAALTAVA